MNNFDQTLEIDDHKQDLIDLYRRYNTDSNRGLTDAKAQEILNRDGPNILSQPKTTPQWIKFCRQIFGGFQVLFWICAILFFIMHGFTIASYHEDLSNSYLWLGIVLIVVVIVTGSFSYYQEAKRSRIMDSLKNMIPQQALVIRNGEKRNVKSEDLVIGDIVEIRSGDCIPADIRIFESTDFKVNNYSLTGETEPQSRGTEFTNENPLETKNLAFSSTFAVEGTAKGLVIRTGDHSIIGRIVANMLSHPSKDDTPIAKEISNWIYIITGVAIFLGVSSFIIALILGFPFIESVILLVVIIVANAPKGILVTMTICLTLTAEKMARKNCLVKNLEAVETLGSTSIICVGKNGTLTDNRMTVAHMWFDGTIFEADFTDDQRNVFYDKNSCAFLALTRCAMLCNRADFKQDPENLMRPVLQRECTGDASETALLRCVELSVGNVSEFREANRKVYEIPFNSTNKYQLSIHEINTNDESDDDSRSYLLVMKGAPERIIERCSTICINGRDMEMNDHLRNLSNRAYLDLSDMGERVLGFCDLRLPNNEYPYGYRFDVDEVNFPVENLRFLGLMSIIDPPRPSAPDAIMKCRSAGIKVIMVTGDHPTTAKAIARSVGIISAGSETVEDIAEHLGISPEAVNSSDANVCVTHGNDLREMSPTQIDALLRDYKEIVFARISPSQKAIIVEGCQRQGAIVAMIGGSVSDLEALKQADVGVAMGIAGSYVSKQAADMVLLDNNLDSIVTGVEEGRLMFDNLSKSIAYTSTSNAVKMIPVLIYLLKDIPLAWVITAILCIDLVNTIGTISLAYEKAETDIMKLRPRDPQHNRLANKCFILMIYGIIGLIQVDMGLVTYLLIMVENGFLPLPVFSLRKSWESKNINNLQNSYGQEWTYEQYKELEFTCYTAFFITIVICQWATLIVCKTSRDSIVQQGMNNLMSNFGMVFGTILIAIISYILTFNTYQFKFYWWLPVLFYVFLILICGEVGNYIIRKNPGGWIKRKLYN